MLQPLDTYQLDTWHLPTEEYRRTMLMGLALLRGAIYSDDPSGDEKSQVITDVAEWLKNVPTRGVE
jgi:hypothetical protein